MSKPEFTVQNAVALAYHKGEMAPKVVAKGKGYIAEEIIARAKEHGIHVHQSTELVSLLMKVDLDKDIPTALYRAVAELLAWLYHIDTLKAGNDANPLDLATYLQPHSDNEENA